ncbi:MULTISPECIES: helix-turn-helix transcriptional regulator [unclassified Chromohalobacter]|uniref:helix-turn-helix transcriptional regulator n=1 Tax=unclassified Chromohalobacter TaxID=2628571 RepID=UPI00246962C9|nr:MULTISPECIES: helix-turn-helix transcriptional regulator [unclassified Chromohalobacter]
MQTKRQTLSPRTYHALQLFANLIEEARRHRRWTQRELAERIGISRATLQSLLKGDPSVAIGSYFEAATLLGVPLFGTDSGNLADLAQQQQQRMTLLPGKTVHRNEENLPDDDF